MKKVFKHIILMIALVFTFGDVLVASAHGLFINLEEPGVFKVEYDGGTPVENAAIQLMDESNEIIDEGVTDSEGIYEFDSSLDPAFAEVSDGMGHHAHYERGVQTQTMSKWPVIIIVALVVVGIFFVYNKRNPKEKASNS